MRVSNRNSVIDGSVAVRLHKVRVRAKRTRENENKRLVSELPTISVRVTRPKVGVKGGELEALLLPIEKCIDPNDLAWITVYKF